MHCPPPQQINGMKQYRLRWFWTHSKIDTAEFGLTTRCQIGILDATFSSTVQWKQLTTIRKRILSTKTVKKLMYTSGTLGINVLHDGICFCFSFNLLLYWEYLLTKENRIIEILLFVNVIVYSVSFSFQIRQMCGFLKQYMDQFN